MSFCCLPTPASPNPPTPPSTPTTPQSQDLYRTSGFSIGIPITLLVSTILKLHFWFGSMFSLLLLAQCLLLACVQAIMLFLCFSKAPPRGIILASAAQPLFHTIILCHPSLQLQVSCKRLGRAHLDAYICNIHILLHVPAISVPFLFRISRQPFRYR